MTAETHMQPTVRIVDVTLRDGLQVIRRDELGLVPTSIKIEWAQRLIAAGVQSLEVTSFASPRRLPQFADAEDVLSQLHLETSADIRVYTPNRRGFDRALAAGARHVVFFLVLSETYQLLNVGQSRSEALDEICKMSNEALRAGVEVNVGLGMSFGCPYDGPTRTEYILEVIERLIGAGVRRVSLADSVGLAGPQEVRSLVTAVLARFGHEGLELGLHLHNVHNMAAMNARVGISLGVKELECTSSGIGGGIAMPGDRGIVPNFPTESARILLERIGIACPISADLHSEFVDDVVRHLGWRQPVASAMTNSWSSTIYPREEAL